MTQQERLKKILVYPREAAQLADEEVGGLPLYIGAIANAHQRLFHREQFERTNCVAVDHLPSISQKGESASAGPPGKANAHLQYSIEGQRFRLGHEQNGSHPPRREVLVVPSLHCPYAHAGVPGKLTSELGIPPCL